MSDRANDLCGACHHTTVYCSDYSNKLLILELFLKYIEVTDIDNLYRLVLLIALSFNT